MVSSCPSTPGLYSDSSRSTSRAADEPDNTLPALDPVTNEYRLSHRRLRQLSPLSHKTLSANDVTTEDVPKHGFSNELLPDHVSASAPSIVAQPPPTAAENTVAENFRHMWSVIRDLLKNTRYLCIIVANLFEGILIKGTARQPLLDANTRVSLLRICALHHQVLRVPTSTGHIDSDSPDRCHRSALRDHRLSARRLLHEQILLDADALRTRVWPSLHHLRISLPLPDPLLSRAPIPQLGLPQRKQRLLPQRLPSR